MKKKKYTAPEWEIVTFSPESMMTTCSSDDCSTCYYLVCEPTDVIIGG